MQFAEDKSRGQFHIRSYDQGTVLINDTRYSESLIITPDELLTDWQPDNVEQLETDHFAPVLALAPQVLVLGTGDSLTFPRPQQLACLYQAGIGVEVMDTAAACRTYNVLVSEDRAVVGALLFGQ